MTAAEIKQWFKKTYNIPVNVRTGDGHIFVWIPFEPRKPGAPMIYKHKEGFPKELGNACMRMVYKGHPHLEEQNWGGNICTHQITMATKYWECLIPHTISIVP